MANDRPPIQGVVGRTSGQIRLTVCENTQQQTIQPADAGSRLRIETRKGADGRPLKPSNDSGVGDG